MYKKLIILSVLFSFFFLPCLADEAEEITLDELDTLNVSKEVELIKTEMPPVVAPKWEEFCEAGYENAKYVEKENILNLINFVDAERTKSNYWAERRANFQKAVDHCNTLTDDKKAFCYDGVRNAENERNSMYEQQRKQIIYKNRGIIIDKPNY